MILFQAWRLIFFNKTPHSVDQFLPAFLLNVMTNTLQAHHLFVRKSGDPAVQFFLAEGNIFHPPGDPFGDRAQVLPFIPQFLQPGGRANDLFRHHPAAFAFLRHFQRLPVMLVNGRALFALIAKGLRHDRVHKEVIAFNQETPDRAACKTAEGDIIPIAVHRPHPGIQNDDPADVLWVVNSIR